MSAKDDLILSLLQQHPEGLYGSELVTLSKGKFGLGTVYTRLEYLVDEGLVREEKQEKDFFGRTKHFITNNGRRHLLNRSTQLNWTPNGPQHGTA